jgi:hypothetical protein
LNQPLNSSNTESDQSRTRPKHSIASRSHERLLLDRDVDAQLGQHLVNAGIEVRHRHSVGELEPLRASIRGANDKGVVDEIEADLEGRVAVMQAPRRQPPNIEVQRDVPPVVARRRGGEPDLAQDLGV